MREFNTNYLGDGAIILYNDRDVEMKINSMSVFSDRDTIKPSHVNRLSERFELPEMEYKRGAYTCVGIDITDWYKVTVIQGWDEGDVDTQEYLVLKKDINQEIDELEQHWSTEAISQYLIHQMTREGDYKYITNDEIYKSQDQDPVTGEHN